MSGRKESFAQENFSKSQQTGDEIKVAGKLNKLQVYIDSKIGEIRTLNDQLTIAQQELELAEKEKESLEYIFEQK